MDVSKLTQTELEERWKWLLDDNDFTEVDVEYEVNSDKPLASEVFYE